MSLEAAETGSAERQYERGVGAPEYYVVTRMAADTRGQCEIWQRIGVVIERLNANLRRVVRVEGFDSGDVECGLNDGRYGYLARSDLLANIPRESAGIGITGGGDCAGIADCLSALALNLRKDLAMFGVQNAGAGLVKPPEEFDDSLIVVDSLLARDFAGQSSTPFGSSRVDALRHDRENTLANINGRPFFYGTGGNDHLGLLERIAAEFPDMPVVGTFKSVDGDGWINDRPAQMLGFNSAVENYRNAIYNAAQSAAAHGQVDVVEVFGRNCGRLAFESARKDGKVVDTELARKMEEFGDTVMILAPEKPVSLASLAEEVGRRKARYGSCVVVVAEGFLPPEMYDEIRRLSADSESGNLWKDRQMSNQQLLDLVDDSTLKEVLRDSQLADQFANVVWHEKRDAYGNSVKLAGVRRFIIAAIQRFGGISKVNELIQNYEARGVAPNEFDKRMGYKVGKRMAEVINAGIKGGKAVVYFEGMNPVLEDPVVVDLVGVSDKNNLKNEGLYPESTLRRGGVFW